jgi:phosphate transport system permease protein
MAQSTTLPVGNISRVASEESRLQRRKLYNSAITSLIVLLTAISVGVLLLIFMSIIFYGVFTYTTYPDQDTYTQRISDRQAAGTDLAVIKTWTNTSTGEVTEFTFNSAFWNNITKESIDNGLASAVWGTLEMLALAAIIAVPLGLASAIYLSEYGKGQFAAAVRFTLDLLSQMPSIIIGLFMWMFIVNYKILKNSGLAGSLGLAIIILPIVARTVEEILRLVPDHLREAGLALGTPRWRVILGVVVPTVFPGIVMGIILALARASGETAPLLLVTGSNITNFDPLKPIGAIPLQIYSDATLGTPESLGRAWGAALILVIVIATFSAIVRFVTGRVRYEY